jgi:peroxiredoxin
MKRIILLVALTAIIFPCNSQAPHYVIKGKIDGAEGTILYLQKVVNGKMENVDTAVVTNGSFTMKGGSVIIPEMVVIITADRKKGVSFYLENAEITITGNIESLGQADIRGSKTQDDFNSLSLALKPLEERYNSINADIKAATSTGDLEKLSKSKKQMNDLILEAKAVQKEFVKSHPASYASPSILRGLASEMQSSELESIINAMDPAVAGTPTILELKAKLASLKIVDIGKKAPDFTMNDPKGNPVKLSSMFGSKLLLIDFWAAWCSPCRAENPNVVKVYNEFHSKGFNIIGVSLDRSGADWTKAISDDKLTWTHVSDLQYWNNAAAKLYGVNSIPANFLLDKDGIIIAKNLRGDALYNKVKELTGTK